jgi:cold shock CspA family protein
MMLWSAFQQPHISANRRMAVEKSMAERDAEREQGCTERTDKMTGIVKKIDAQGFGIIDGADGSKVPFISSDVMNRCVLEPGQKVIFSVRRVKDQAFAENVIVVGQRHNWRGGA